MKKIKYPLPTKEEAEELKRLRKEACMTVSGIAEALHISNSSISEYENAKRGICPELIEKVKKRYKAIIESNRSFNESN